MTILLSRGFKVNQWTQAVSTPLPVKWSIVWCFFYLCPWVDLVSQAPQQFSSSESLAIYFYWMPCQPVCLALSSPLTPAYPAQPKETFQMNVEHCNVSVWKFLFHFHYFGIKLTEPQRMMYCTWGLTVTFQNASEESLYDGFHFPSSKWTSWSSGWHYLRHWWEHLALRWTPALTSLW